MELSWVLWVVSVYFKFDWDCANFSGLLASWSEIWEALGTCMPLTNRYTITCRLLESQLYSHAVGIYHDLAIILLSVFPREINPCMHQKTCIVSSTIHKVKICISHKPNCLLAVQTIRCFIFKKKYRQWKLMNYNYIEKHGWVLKAQLWVIEAYHKIHVILQIFLCAIQTQSVEKRNLN